MYFNFSCKEPLPVYDYFTMLSLLVSSSQWRGRGKGREFTLPGNRQFKIQYQKDKNQIKIIKTKTKLLSVQYKQGQSGPVHWSFEKMFHLCCETRNCATLVTR
jgi:hypothetical protein